MRQAVVIIHGIGEQKPMDTLRGFVDSVLPERSSGEPKFWSKPDRMSESFELRRLTARSTASRPVTDFYEYYWAYHMRDTKYRHVMQWFVQLLLRKPQRVPRRLLPVWVASWVLLLFGVFFGGGSVSKLTSLAAASKLNFLISVLSFVLFYLLNWFALGYIGDAARYLNPSPENIAQRRRIRADGIKLLRRLHRSEQYDRIIVVGHSLGSVIAYDIIKHLWIDFNTCHGKPVDISQRCLKDLEEAGQALGENPSIVEIDSFRQKQRDLWREQRRLGNPWLVTDLITLGSPLVHAQILLAQGEIELRARQWERELPVCPPVAENKSYAYKLAPYKVDDKLRTVRVLHHAAPFACTRWTNIYFPGDVIGGSLNRVFGAGIKDVCVYTQRYRALSYLPLAHTWYWRKELAVSALRDALDLESKHSDGP